jgi:hypothetical protein
LVTIEEIQAAYYMVAATGVLVAAAYYIQNLRINEKIRRRDLVFQKLQPSTRDFLKAMFNTWNMTDWNTIEEYRSKYVWKVNPEANLDFYYVLNHFNALGILYKDGIADPEQIFQLYNSYSLIAFYEKFEPLIMVARLTPSGELHNPDMYKPFELLYREAKRRYPKSGKLPASKEELLEHGRFFDEHLGLKKSQ